MQTTVGQILVNHGLPKELQDYTRVLDKKGIERVLQQAAKLGPEVYRDAAQHLATMGWQAAQATGANSFGPEHLQLSVAGRKAQIELQRKIREIRADPNLTDHEKAAKTVEVLSGASKQLTKDVLDESLATRNPLAMQVLSGARGNPTNLRSLLAGDLLYVDHRNRPIPIPILRSYAQGLSPAQYYASTFGARKGVVDTKLAVRNAGFACLAAGTKVRMADGSSRSIERLAVGDLVLGASLAGKTFPVRVTAVFDNGEKDVWRYRFRVGKARDTYIEVDATADHRVLAKVKRGRAGTPHGDKNSILSPTKLPLSRASQGFRLVPMQGTETGFDGGVNEPLALWLGLLLGNGGLTTSGLMFSTGNTDLVEQLNNGLLAEHRFFLKKRPGADKVEYRVVDLERLAGDAAGGDRAFRHRGRKWLHGYGLLGRYSHEKFIPKDVYAWNLSSVAALLAGLFEADGCVTASNNSPVPLVTLSLTSLPLVASTRDLLATKFGIHTCPPRLVPKETKEHATHDQYVITVSDRESVFRFARRIKMPTKSAKLEALLPTIAAARNDEYLYNFVEKSSLGRLPTYDIEVDHEAHLFVLDNGAIVSNSKQFNQMTHRLVVSAIDDESPGGEALWRGMPVDTADAENEGALLAREAGGYPRNTALTPKILSDLQAKGHQRILVRSTIVGGHPLGGVYARDVGIRENGDLEPIGVNVGLNAAQSLSEPLQQMTLSSKHAGGVAASSRLGGFELLNQQIQVPSVFKGGAAHSQHDGKVTAIRPAAQGGTYIDVDHKEHYVGRGFEPIVKIGDQVEAGDVLSEGTPNPAELVKHKHIGEGRRAFVHAFRKSYVDSDAFGGRRNIEAVARGLINHVELEKEMDEHVPGDVVPYSSIEHRYQPREGHKVVPPDRAVGLYLERPVLHYSIGTRVRPSILKTLQEFGVPQVTVHTDPPPFHPLMVRAMDNLSHDPDWMTRFLGSNIKKNFLHGVHRGDVSDEAGSSYVPSLARAVHFGRQAPVTSAPLRGPVPTPPRPAPTPPRPAPGIAAQTESILASLGKHAASVEDEIDFGEHADGGLDFYDDEIDEDWYDQGHVRYAAPHFRLCGYEDELGDDLGLLRGDDADGLCGGYRLAFGDQGVVYTKLFYRLSAEQFDTMARAFGHRLAEYPILCQDEKAFARLLASFAKNS